MTSDIVLTLDVISFETACQPNNTHFYEIDNKYISSQFYLTLDIDSIN
jgi:hypothetical protein